MVTQILVLTYIGEALIRLKLDERVIPRENIKFWTKKIKMITKKLNELKNTDLAYMAGFLEGSGCILAQIVNGASYKFKFVIKVSLSFCQKADKHWFFIQMRNQLGIGTIRVKKDGMVEYFIVGMPLVKAILKKLFPFLILKKKLAILTFSIIEKYSVVQTEADFIEVCKLVDKIAEHTYSKKRINTSLVVVKALGLPVETER